MDDRSTSGVLIGIIIVLVIGIIAWLAYTRGFFSGNAANTANNPSIQLEVNGGNTPGTPSAGDSGNTGNTGGSGAPSY